MASSRREDAANSESALSCAWKRFPASTLALSIGSRRTTGIRVPWTIARYLLAGEAALIVEYSAARFRNSATDIVYGQPHWVARLSGELAASSTVPACGHGI